MEALEHDYQEFTELLTEEELYDLAVQYGAAEQRDRKLPIRIFFWLMILSAGQPTLRGGLFQLAAFFVAALTQLFPLHQAITLTKMALSKRMSCTSWFFFRAVYNRLLWRYQKDLPASQCNLFSRFREAFALDSTVTRVVAALEKCFQSVHKGKAAVKLNVRFSLKNLAADKIQATSGRRHDSRFAGITNQPGILYLFDLGYWAFTRLKKIIDAKSFFVSRLKSSCDPLIVEVKDQNWQHLVGQRLSQIIGLLKPDQALDVQVKLSKAKKPRFDEEIRLVGLFYEDIWRFYITNLFETAFTPQIIYDLYRQRWSIEIFFNQIKHLLHLEHLISRNKNGIMVEVYSALIFHLLTRIIIALAAKKTHQPVETFSFSRSFDLVRAFLSTHLGELLRATHRTLICFLQHLVEAVARMGLKDQASPSETMNYA